MVVPVDGLVFSVLNYDIKSCPASASLRIVTFDKKNSLFYGIHKVIFKCHQSTSNVFLPCYNRK